MNPHYKISFIGTGSMGRPMIFELLKHGYAVCVYDKYKETADSLIDAGALWKASPKEVAQGADIVLTCLPLPEHVLENMLGENGALEGMRKGSTWIDCSTTDYHNTKRIADVAAQKGVYSLEAPVSNLSHMGVDFANVSFYAGGDRAGFEMSSGVLDDMGKISFYVGEIGRGQTVKLLTNLLFYSAMIAWGEVLVLAKTYGLPLHTMWDEIKKSKGNCFVTEQMSPFIFDGSYDHSCTLEITVKDTALTVALADELHVQLNLGRIVAQRYRKAGLRFKAHDNHGIVMKLIEEENTLDFRIAGMIAPSKYGMNRDHVMSEQYVTDAYGRVKPLLSSQYDAPKVELNEDLRHISTALTDFMAYSNYSILQESYQLGEAMGLSREQLREVVRWSCGPSWVADHEDRFQPEDTVLTRIATMVEKQPQLHLPLIQNTLQRT